jgi:uncharacterized membrane protein
MMSKADFFTQLQERLRGLPYEEQQNIIRVYEDLFRQAEMSGKSDREVIESLGFIPIPVHPAAAPPEKRSGSAIMRSAENGIRFIIAAIALGLFNLIFILGPLVGFAAVLFSLSLVAVLFTFSSIWIILGTGMPTSFSVLLLEIFSALALTGLGVLLGIGMWKVNIGFCKLVKRYIRMNIKLIRGE